MAHTTSKTAATRAHLTTLVAILTAALDTTMARARRTNDPETWETAAHYAKQRTDYVRMLDALAIEDALDAHDYPIVDETPVRPRARAFDDAGFMGARRYESRASIAAHRVRRVARQVTRAVAAH